MSIKPSDVSTKLFATWLNKNSNFMQIVGQKSAFLHKVNNLLQEALPQNLQTNFRVANLQATKLILYTTKASNLISFRFCQQDILLKLQERMPWLTSIEVKVRPAQMLITEPVFKQLVISESSKNSLANLASQVDNPKLKQALLTLAQKKAANN